MKGRVNGRVNGGETASKSAREMFPRPAKALNA